MIYIDLYSKKPKYEQIYEQIKAEIDSGVRRVGDVLEGSRTLARTLQVSRNTVDAAYGQLVAEGYITNCRGIGFIVEAIPQSLGNQKKHRMYQEKKTIQSEEKSTVYDLTNGNHTRDLFPVKLWKRCMWECLLRAEADEYFATMCEGQGILALRSCLKEYLAKIRGLSCEEEQIVITCGLQQSLDLVCKILPSERRSVYVEEPGYNKAVAVLKNNDRNVNTIRVDKKGLVTGELELNSDVCAIYTTPSNQFPTGSILPIGRRYELLEWARKNDSYIIEDDYDSELRYYAKPIPSLQSIDEEERVIYMGTFSKALSPALRMAYVVLPKPMLKKYRERFADYNCTVSVINQYVVAELFKTGQYERHVRRMGQIYRKRLEEFKRCFSDWGNKIKIHENGSGQYFLMEFSGRYTQERLIELAGEQGVKVYPVMQFWHDRAECPDNMIFVGFSKIAIKDIEDCVKRLKYAWRTILEE